MPKPICEAKTTRIGAIALSEALWDHIYACHEGAMFACSCGFDVQVVAVPLLRLSDEEANLVVQGKKIHAIKAMRDRLGTGTSLLQCKKSCDAYEASIPRTLELRSTPLTQRR